MRSNIFVTGLAAGMLVLVPGCSDDTVAPPPGGSGGLSAAELADVALQSDLDTEQILIEQLDAMGTTSAAITGDEPTGGTKTVTFSRTRSCPGGGQLAVEGTIQRSFDPATGVMEARSSGSRTRTDCTFPRRQMTITVNSSSQWETFRRRVNGVPEGLQTSHYFGSVHAVRSDGEERSCEFDIAIVRDPENHTRTLDGIICGTTVHRSVSWSFDS